MLSNCTIEWKNIYNVPVSQKLDKKKLPFSMYNIAIKRCTVYLTFHIKWHTNQSISGNFTNVISERKTPHFLWVFFIKKKSGVHTMVRDGLAVWFLPVPLSWGPQTVLLRQAAISNTPLPLFSETGGPHYSLKF